MNKIEYRIKNMQRVQVPQSWLYEEDDYLVPSKEEIMIQWFWQLEQMHIEEAKDLSAL